MTGEQTELSATRNIWGKMQWKDSEVVEADFIEKKPICEYALFGFFLLPLKSSTKKSSVYS